MKGRIPIRNRSRRVKSRPEFSSKSDSANRKPASASVTKGIRSVLGFLIRWIVVVLMLSLLLGQMAEKKATIETADEMTNRYAEFERERSDLESELEIYNDPDLRASYWKWRTMSHEPGEYFIDFR